MITWLFLPQSRVTTLVAATVLVSGCGLAPISAQPEVRLVVVNGGPSEATLVVEQSDGEVIRFPYQPCSAHSELVSTAWHVEVDNEIVLESVDVQPLPDAPVTVVTLTILPDGTVQVAEPIRAERPPDVPIRFDCA